ncbi:MAG: DeoR/GlpR transcriptional regulator [Oscillospiraceae bacterium]|nr:DeoR/GlpR transcriptional regulator [Oscillospiraceae bacterium]
MYSIRQETMRDYIEDQNVVTIKQLQALFPEVSLMTIHRDLDSLEKAGAVVKFRGGAKSVRHAGDVEFNIRMQANNPGKSIMARKALSLLQPHSAIFLDASTTNLALAKVLPDMNLNIFTTGPSIALELCRLHNPVVTMCCGTMNRKNLALSGQNTLKMLENINIDLAFIGVSGCSVEAGFTCGTEADMLVKRMVIQKARTSVLMCGRDKLSCLMPYTFAKFEDVDYLISDEPMPDDFIQAAQGAGVILL